jgi:hypothetical protein
MKKPPKKIIYFLVLLLAVSLAGVATWEFHRQKSHQGNTNSESRKSQTVMPFFKDGKLGFIDSKGKTVVKSQFDDAMAFSEGLAAVMVNDKWGFIDKNGNMVVKPQFDNVEGFSEGLAAVMVGRKWGYIDTKGDMVIKPQFDEIDSFSEGRAGVLIGKKWKTIDRQGNIVKNP